MLQKLRVGGFRSLLDFEIEIKPGLNVLVGTNGAGKSNFVAALDFLSKFIPSGLHDGLASIGGAAFAFSVESLATTEPEFMFEASGSISRERLLANAKRIGLDPKYVAREQTLNYVYRCKVVYLKKSAVVHVAEEDVELMPSGTPKFQISRRTSFADGVHKSTVEATPQTHDLYKQLSEDFSRPDKKVSFEEQLCSYIRPETSMVRMLVRPFSSLAEIYQDLTNLGSINIDPQAAKKATPIPHPEELQPTGQGLAATLYALEHGQYAPFRRTGLYYYKRMEEQDERRLFKSIVNWAQEVHSGIVSITTRLEPEEVVIKPFARIKVGETLSHLYPFSKLSDGTIKWIALTTVMIAEPHYSVIEEPENFLHPRMQELFIAIAREFSGDAAERQALLVTTHSESLLNACAPEELVVLYRSERGTKAARIKDASDLKERLSKSVFGLGYVYRTGGIDEGDIDIS